MSQSSTAIESDGEIVPFLNTEVTVQRTKSSKKSRQRQGKYWILTIPKDDFTPPETLEDYSELTFIRGQLESGDGTGYEHWQVVAYFERKCTISAVKRIFGKRCHCELTRSDAARSYVWKDETSLGSRFELGTLPTRRNKTTDWDVVWSNATRGDLDAIDAQIRVCHYNNLRRIYSDIARPVAIERNVYVYWGESGTGKSRQAWDNGGLDSYPKCPRTKFWDGYIDQRVVIIDEFRGGIDIGHLLRWFDRYPIFVEVKGASRPLLAETIYITSNLSPKEWFPELDNATYAALRRRLTKVIHFSHGLTGSKLVEE